MEEVPHTLPDDTVHSGLCQELGETVDKFVIFVFNFGMIPGCHPRAVRVRVPLAVLPPHLVNHGPLLRPLRKLLHPGTCI